MEPRELGGAGVGREGPLGRDFKGFRVDAVHELAEAADRAEVQPQRRLRPDRPGQRRERGLAGAEVQERARPAPAALAGARAQREQAAGGRQGDDGHRAAFGEGGGAGEGEGDAGRDRQAEGGQAGEVGGAAAVGFRPDGVAGVEADHRVTRVAKGVSGLHCGAA